MSYELTVAAAIASRIEAMSNCLNREPGKTANYINHQSHAKHYVDECIPLDLNLYPIDSIFKHGDEGEYYYNETMVFHHRQSIEILCEFPEEQELEDSGLTEEEFCEKHSFVGSVTWEIKFTPSFLHSFKTEFTLIEDFAGLGTENGEFWKDQIEDGLHDTLTNALSQVIDTHDERYVLENAA